MVWFCLPEYPCYFLLVVIFNLLEFIYQYASLILIDVHVDMFVVISFVDIGLQF